MKNAKFLLAILLLIAGMSGLAVVKINQSGANFTFLEGEDCNIEHGFFIDYEFSLIDNDSINNVNQPFSVNITFIPNDPDIYYYATFEIIDLPANISALTPTVVQIDNTTSVQTASWILNTSYHGIYTVSISCNLTIGVTSDFVTHPGYIATYSGVFVGMFESVETPIIPPPFNPFLGILESLSQYLNSITLRGIGGIAGFFGISLLFLSMILGQKEIQFSLVNKLQNQRVTREFLVTIHCWLSGFSFVFVIFHFVFLSLSQFWRLIFTWWDFVPQFILPISPEAVRSFRDILFSLNLGRIAFTIMILTLIGGLLFKRLTTRFSYRSSLLIQQGSYLLLPLLIIHCRTLGTLTKTVDLIFWILVLLSSVILIMRVFFLVKARKRVVRT